MGTVENASVKSSSVPRGTHFRANTCPGTKVPGYVHSFLRNDGKPTFAEVSFRAGRPAKTFPRGAGPGYKVALPWGC